MTSVPEEVKDVCRCLRGSGFEAYIVGGAVRDYYMSRVPKDWDISTNAPPEKVTEIFGKVVPTGIKYGTVTVYMDGMGIEVTTYRNDGKYSDGRRPDEVAFAETIEEDLSRRDFRMNAMALDPLTNRVLDPFHGQLDIAEKVINTVGNSQDRFDEDGLRIMRAVRFASQLSFTICHDVSRAITKNRRKLESVSIERIRDELLKILASENPRYGITFLCDSGLMDMIIPQFLRTKGCMQNKWHSFDVYNHSINVMEVLPPDPVFRLVGLLHDIGKPDTQTPHPHNKGEFRFLNHAKVGSLYAEGIAKRLKLSGDDVKRVVHLVKHHMRLMDIPQTDSGIRKLIRDLRPECVEEFITFRRADMSDSPKKQVMVNEFDRECNRIRKVLQENPVLDSKGLAINGHDIMEHLGISGGPEVGKIIHSLTEKVIADPSLNTKDRLLNLIGGGNEVS